MPDLKVVFAAFASVFLAEMGDKTQLATLALAAGSSRWAVFIGASLALVATTAIAVLGADLVARYVDPAWIRRAAGVMFLAMGAYFLLKSTP